MLLIRLPYEMLQVEDFLSATTKFGRDPDDTVDNLNTVFSKKLISAVHIG